MINGCKIYNPETDLETVINLPLKEVDYEEVKAATGLTDTVEIWTRCLNGSTETYIMIYETEVIGAFGVNTQPDKTGVIWMLTTDVIYKKQFPIKIFMEYCRICIEHFKKHHSLLFNMCATNNKLTIKWLRVLGFTFCEQKVNMNGTEFVPFFIRGAVNLYV